MREIYYTSKFKRLYKKLDSHFQPKVKSTIIELQNNPFSSKLKVHKLSWKLSSYYSYSVDYNNRIIFEIQSWWNLCLFLVWGHDIYK